MGSSDEEDLSDKYSTSLPNNTFGTQDPFNGQVSQNIHGPFVGQGDDDYVIQKLWDQALRLYTACQLTMEDDKEAAVFGILQSLSETNLEAHTLGLWNSRLLFELLWTVKQDTQTFRPALYRAPTWSWLSGNNHPFLSSTLFHTFQWLLIPFI